MFNTNVCPENIIITQAYLQWNEEIRRVWVFSTESAYLNPVMIDMDSSEILQ